ncbi:MAG TPA: sugar O-acetyltransferase [Actinomycetota bacterium]|jgi:maltose O-acetyltransferase
MVRGELYDASDPELTESRRRCRALLRRFNDSDDEDERDAVLRELCASVGERTFVQPPMYCDYGWNLSIGANTFVNFGMVALDVAPITIGERCQVGPGVQLLAATHPVEPELRRTGAERAAPISVESNVWLGGAVIVCPGVTIGEDAVIGAGSVVTRDVPPGVVAAGNPCRVIRSL